MRDDDWGLQVGNLSLEDTFGDGWQLPSDGVTDESSTVLLSNNIKFPLELIYQVVFIGGKRGSGKSYSAAVIMEELNRLGLQFVCIDPLDAHGYLSELPGVEAINPSRQETINMKKLIDKLKNSNSSLVINMSGLSLDLQQKLIAEYCEALLEAKLGDRGLLTILEECQDFVPQLGRPSSFASIVRLCKLGRAKGYGVALISQRPAAVSKEALSQASIYMIHNVINTKDLDALKEQLSFGTDKETIQKILSGITYAGAGEMVCYAPEFFKDEGYVIVGKVDRPRRTEHKGKNIDVRASLGGPTSFAASGDVPPKKFDFSNIRDALESEDDMSDDDEDMSEEETQLETYEWVPHGTDLLDSETTSHKTGGRWVSAASAIGLISMGVYFVTRGLAQKE